MRFRELDESLVNERLSLTIASESGHVWAENELLTLSTIFDLQASGFTHVFTNENDTVCFLDTDIINYIYKEFADFSQIPEVLLDSNYLRMLLEALYKYDITTFEHSVQVAKLMYRFASILAYTDSEIAHMTLTGLLHDIGKCCIPKYILCSDHCLSKSARKLMENHPIYSGVLIAKRWDSNLAKTITQHHEKSDGSGYPLGLDYSEISTKAYILSMCDVYHALCQKRPYKVAYNPELAYEIMKNDFTEKFLIERFSYIVEEDTREMFMLKEMRRF